MSDNPALYSNRKTDVGSFSVGQRVKILPVEEDSSPGIDVDEEAEFGDVKEVNWKTKTIKVDDKTVNPARVPVYTRGGKRRRKSKKNKRRQTRRK